MWIFHTRTEFRGKLVTKHDDVWQETIIFFYRILSSAVVVVVIVGCQYFSFVYAFDRINFRKQFSSPSSQSMTHLSSYSPLMASTSRPSIPVEYKFFKIQKYWISVYFLSHNKQLSNEQIAYYVKTKNYNVWAPYQCVYIKNYTKNNIFIFDYTFSAFAFASNQLKWIQIKKVFNNFICIYSNRLQPQYSVFFFLSSIYSFHAMQFEPCHATRFVTLFDTQIKSFISFCFFFWFVHISQSQRAHLHVSLSFVEGRRICRAHADSVPLIK